MTNPELNLQTQPPPKFQAVLWAWAAGWALVSIGQQLWGVYDSPTRGVAPYLIFGIAGWALGAIFTIRYVRQRFGADGRLAAFGAVGWGLGALVAMLLGLSLVQTWDAGFLGLIVAPALGATIGGAFTITRRSSSPAAIVAGSLRGALGWGLSFLLFELLAFYAGYILSAVSINLLAPSLGDPWAKVPGWALPAGAGGYAAALVALFATKLLQVSERSQD